MPELTALDAGKSKSLLFPANGTAGFALMPVVKGLNLLPAPPAKIKQ